MTMFFSSLPCSFVMHGSVEPPFVPEKEVFKKAEERIGQYLKIEKLLREKLEVVCVSHQNSDSLLPASDSLK